MPDVITPITPALVIDAAVVGRNLARLAAYCTAYNINLRPHTKTHKSKFLAALQLKHGAKGLTVAKPSEALVMSEVCDDLLLAYPAVGAARTYIVAELAQRITMRVAIDSAEAARGLSAAAVAHDSSIGILIDLDVGLHRTGVQSPQAALALARQVSRLPGLRVDGLMVYPGHHRNNNDAMRDMLIAANGTLQEAVDLFNAAGLSTAIRSGGSTPAAMDSHRMPALTEIRPGTYIFNDMNSVHGGMAQIADCAARIHTTIISTAYPGQFVIDAGSKTLTHDPCGPNPASGFGHIIEFPNARITKLSEEHGQVECAKGDEPRVGQSVTVIPNHICPCINLQNKVYWREKDSLRELNVDARG